MLATFSLLLIVFIQLQLGSPFVLLNSNELGDIRISTIKCFNKNQDGDVRFRINKCFPFLSRREADKLILEGRVTINGKSAVPGDRVDLKDVVCLDGKRQAWEKFAIAKSQAIGGDSLKRQFYYLKYWKPRGVTCTTDESDPSNIIKAGGFNQFPQRLFTVGRLDKDSSGLILLTSDGRINNALLSKSYRREKIYEVEMDRVPTISQLEKLANGVVITTPSQRDHGVTFVTAKTLPCEVSYVSPTQKASRFVRFILIEGRNRQIRRMAEAVGLRVVSLHRVSFGGISLEGLKEGDWKELNDQELHIIRSSVSSNLSSPE